MADHLGKELKKYRGVKSPEQFLPYFSRIPEIVTLRKSFKVRLETQAQAMSVRTQWYAYVKALEIYNPGEDITLQAKGVIARAKNGELEFIHRDRTEVAVAFKSALDEIGGDSLDQAYDAALKAA